MVQNLNNAVKEREKTLNTSNAQHAQQFGYTHTQGELYAATLRGDKKDMRHWSRQVTSEINNSAMTPKEKYIAVKAIPLAIIEHAKEGINGGISPEVAAIGSAMKYKNQE